MVRLALLLLLVRANLVGHWDLVDLRNQLGLLALDRLLEHQRPSGLLGPSGDRGAGEAPARNLALNLAAHQPPGRAVLQG